MIVVLSEIRGEFFDRLILIIHVIQQVSVDFHNDLARFLIKNENII